MLTKDMILTRAFLNNVRQEISPVTVPLLSKMVGGMLRVGDLAEKFDGLQKLQRSAAKSAGTGTSGLKVPGELIFRIRKSLFLTQNRFGRFVGTSRFSVSNWEHSKTIPHSTQNELILELLDTSIRDIRHLLERKNMRASKRIKPVQSIFQTLPYSTLQ